MNRKRANYSPIEAMFNKNNPAASKSQPNYVASSKGIMGSPSRSKIHYQDSNFNSRPTSRQSFQQDDGTYRSHFDDIDIDGQLPTIDHRFHPGQQQTNVKTTSSSDQDHDGPQDVYICNCCCISRELQPAYKHLSSLSSLFFLFNFLVFAFGFACLGMGLWLRIDPKIYEIHKYIETQNFTYAGWIILFGGFASCLISLLGFIGTGKQSQCLLISYMVIMLALAISFIGSLVLLIVHGLGSELELFLQKEIYEQMRRRAMSNQNDWAARFLDFIQVKMRCCGAVDFLDYGKLGLVVPTSCYAIEKNYIQAHGCGRAIRNLLDIRAGLAVGFLAGSILSQLLCLILAMILSCSIYQLRTNSHRELIEITRPISPLKISYPGQITISPTADAACRESTHQDVDEFKRVHLNPMQRPRSRTPIVF